MATTNIDYGTNGQTITITLASLANAGQRESTAIDNTTNKYLDALVMLKMKTHASSASTGDKAIYVYAYGTVDNGTTYTDTATGSDAAITLTSPPNMRLLGVINAPTAATTYKGGPWSVAAVFGGILPAKWGIVVENKTGFSLDATGGSFVAQYQGIQSVTA